MSNWSNSTQIPGIFLIHSELFSAHSARAHMQELGNVNLVDSSNSKLIQIQLNPKGRDNRQDGHETKHISLELDLIFILSLFAIWAWHKKDKIGVHGHGHTDSDLKTLLAFILCDGVRQSFAQLKGKNDQVCIRWKKLRQAALVNTN